MSRAEKLREFLKNADEGERELVDNLIDEVIFMEKQLKKLRNEPFIRVNPKNRAIQQPTEAAKLYKSLIQQYNNSVKTLAVVFNRSANEGEHPFTAWLKEQKK